MMVPHSGIDQVLVVAVADQQKFCARRLRADRWNRVREHVHTVPASKRAAETDDAVAVSETELVAKTALLFRTRGRVVGEIRTVWIHENLRLGHSACHQGGLDFGGEIGSAHVGTPV